MSYELKATSCCGVNEINNLSHVQTPEEALYQTGKKYFLDGWRQIPFIMFTGVVYRRIQDHASSRVDDYGQTLQDSIEKLKLGKVVRSSAEMNIRHTLATSNDMRVWLWTPDWKNFQVWFRQYEDKLPKPEVEQRPTFRA